MITPEHLQRREDESVDSYHIRLFENQDDYDIDKYTIANLLNEASGKSYDESKWRKDYALYKKWRDYILQNNLDDERLQLYEEARLEQEKEKVRQQDQKREYRKMVRNSARFEKLQDDIRYAVGELEKVKPLPQNNSIHMVSDEEKHGLSLWSDWHFGMEIDNNTNRYNKDIFNLRLRELIDKTIEHGIQHKISTLHIAQLGDLLAGFIHVSTRVQANEDLIEQIKYVSERLAEAINELANVFPNIVYYNVIGNHGRAGKKSEVGITENFEYLVPWFLEARLSHLDNLEMITDKDGYIVAKIFDQDVIYTHGNFDQADRAVTRLPQLVGVIPSYIFSGHIHHNYTREHGVTTVCVNSSMIGNDDFATQGRYGGRPSQKFFVFDKEIGMECEYIIKFKN
ncbi:hypothetical protein CIL05_06890 [Virgibacillus profundi]|uniref:Calcineurin-like phosphoesterase domain-containing protein n=1 Tax=Virgibacillus profundi TaxID=2024555 RepID=A0A2A2IFQ0_9BACI|nr:hypothetical protein [Virgibacillus profundi]PAV30188.1 hypothetical protein CIL05_06890 [Virgibacillus profundi]PXY54360.1 hypothetical protein CIT14_06975 [Virgibacillus profundi]